MADSKKPNIFQKVLGATDLWLDAQIQKGKEDVVEQRKQDDDDQDESNYFYRKSVSKDQSFYLGTQGYSEKPFRLTYDHLKQMSLKDSIISAIIQTRQSQVSGFSKLVKNPFERGFVINLKDEKKILEKIKEELRKSPEFSRKVKPLPADQVKQKEPLDENPDQDLSDVSVDQEEEGANGIGGGADIRKADGDDGDIATDAQSGEIEADLQADTDPDDDSQDSEKDPEATPEEDDIADAEEEQINWRLERKARKILQDTYAERRRMVEQFIQNGGKVKHRPFESKRWNFDAILRAIVRDSYTYDQLGIERVPDNANRIHHIVPVDGSTIRYASPELGKYKSFPLQSNYDILYPEKELAALNEKDALELDPVLLEANKYKWVQVIRGRIERAFTEDELRVGMRNPTSDIFNNGYAVCELELIVNLISSHLNTEFYNQAYFSQGFSAKGILHLKAPLNRRKIETIRQQWQHMIKGSRNSFQTPIFAGMDEVKWIPLTQNHSDIEFQGWLQYLIKMICAVYQIDPQEIGIGMKEEGAHGSGLSGDNTQEKIDLSRDKGLYPLLRFLENFINTNIIDDIDPEFYLEFVGLSQESPKQALDRQKSEAEFKKTLNEIRAEDGLPPLPGADDLILSATYMQWYTQFSPKAIKKAQQDQMNQMTQSIMGQPGSQPVPPNAAEPHVANQLENQSPDATDSKVEKEGREAPPVKKSLSIEYYRL